MGIIVDNGPGPNFRQANKPSEVGQGNVWFNPNSGESSMADGVDYWRVGAPSVGTAGYVMAGTASSSTIDKLTFSTEATSLASGTMTRAIGGASSISNKSTAGYSMGGAISGYPNGSSHVEKMLFSTETGVTLASSLSYTVAAASNGMSSPAAGYMFGGIYNASGKSSKILFSTEAVSTIQSWFMAIPGCSDGVSIGYTFGGGALNYWYTAVYRFPFSTETRTAITSALTDGVYTTGYESSVAGYRLGGHHESPGGGGTNYYLSTVDRILYSNESVVRITSHLASTSMGQTNPFTSYIKGYNAWGSATDYVDLSLIDAMIFSTEAISSIASSMSIIGKWSGGGVENLS